MARSNFLQTENEREAVRRQIKSKMALNNVSPERIASAMGVSVATYCNRLRDVDGLTYRELAGMARLFKCSIGELICEDKLNG